MLAAQAARAKARENMVLGKMSPKKLKKMIREGIPNDLRRELWLELSNGNLLKHDAPKDCFTILMAK